MAEYARSRQDDRHRRHYKKTIDGEEARRGREETTVKIRKEKRQESFQKRRHVGLDAAEEALIAGMPAGERVRASFIAPRTN